MLVMGSNYSAYPVMLARFRTEGEQNMYNITTYEDGYEKLLKTVVNYQATLWVGDVATGADAAECMADEVNYFSGCPPEIAKLRCLDISTTPSLGMPSDPNLAYWDTSILRKRDAQYSMFGTLLLMVVILVMYVLLSMDVTAMVVQPVESMVGLVRRLAENPTLQLEVQSKSKYETESVRIALAKIVGLMQLGFGGAGHEIISANLANSEKVG